MIKDLFGNIIEQPPEKTFEQEYKDYINSAAWKRKRKAVIDRAGGRCERCGITKWSAKLQVHHLTYKHFKKERLDELEVVCGPCHEKRDKERVVRVQREREDRRYNARLDGWAKKVYGDFWHEVQDYEIVEEAFYDWLEKQAEW